MSSTNVIAKCVLQAEDKTVLLIRRSDTDDRRPLQWDFPGGWVDDSEDFVAAAVREIKEEAGLDVAYPDLSLAYTVTKVTDHGNTIWLIFVGRIPKKDPVLSFEHSEFQWVLLDKAIEDIEYPPQKDALTHIRDNHLLE